jgi:Ca-activated chloride channel homolog
MPSYGRTSTVRSHRRGGPRRRTAVTPVLVTVAVISLVGAGVTAGYAYLRTTGCTGKSEATVVVTPRIESIMQRLAVDWQNTSPSVNGLCGSVTIVPREASDMASALTTNWDPAKGAPPDVWVPDSSAWVRKASANRNAERIMPDLQPSLARTPIVIAMPKDLADAAGMSDKPLTWQQIITKLDSSGGWKSYSHPEWGGFKVGLSDPQSSTPGLLALMAISDTDGDGEVTESEQANLLNLKKVIALKTPSTADIFAGLRNAAEEGGDKGLTFVSAFPALEQDVLDYNLEHPKVPLEAVYPQDGVGFGALAEADFPYLILNASWTTAQRHDVATAFLHFARSPQGKEAFLSAGLRDSNRAPGPELVPANGVESRITALPLAILLPESVEHAAASWTAVTRATNVLLVFDTSGSMDQVVPGTGGKSRLDLTKAAAQDSLKLFDSAARVGVWAFSTVNGGKDYRRILQIQALGDPEGTGTHLDAVENAINDLRAGGNTGLYNTTFAACQEVLARRVDGAANLVVLLTDGADDNNVSGGLTLDQLAAKLRDTCGDPGKPVKVITIGLGVKADSQVLRTISDATNASSYSSPTSFDISQVLLSALFS